MSDIDPRLRARFATYRDDLKAQFVGPGPDQARRTLRRRRRTAVVAVAAAAAIVVAVPVVANAALDRNRNVPTPAVSVEPTTTPPSSSPSPSASSPPTASPTTSATPDAPNGRISRAQLLAARVDLPAWPSPTTGSCATSNVRLRTNNTTVYVSELPDEPLEYGDVDGDGATETIALVACRYGEALSKQVVAFDRNEKGQIVTMGRVARTADGVHDILEMAVGATGSVQVRVADLQPCCGTPTRARQEQLRTYRWLGDRFTQTDGPTKFGQDPRLTDLVLTGGDLVLGPAGAGGRRTGTLKLTVTNKGPLDVAHVGIDGLEQVGTRNGGDFSLCEPFEGGESADTCLAPGLRSGNRRTYTFRLLVDPATLGQPAVWVTHYDSKQQSWRDLTSGDDRVNVRVIP
ncbi:hypothetical protein [Micromonospora sp. 067-2]|uniref:hypothetical protein n=1 Tax=Micromonospora sp. 067-2 TaxID=2789270 RepID=UPI00397C1F9A